MSAPTQAEKGTTFRALHTRAGAFFVPNPWDAGSARILAHLGFEALATTSAGVAFSAGRRDNRLGRERMLAHVAAIAAATDLPVSADLENGYGDDPETVAETIRLAARTGVVGASIEDSTTRPHEPIYQRGHAVERVRAAAEAARSLGFPFVLTARAENFLIGRPDLADTIGRLQAYQEAGADVLFAPGLVDRNDIATVLAAVDRPLNVLAWPTMVPPSLAALAELGVKRVSVGSSLARVALGALHRAARELREHGTFDYISAIGAQGEINASFEE